MEQNNKLENQNKQNSESTLIALLRQNSLHELTNQSSEKIKLLVYDMSVGLTIEKALTAPKMFQLKKSLGEATLIKLICVVLRSFCDSIKATKAMDAVDTMECSELLIEKYSHDSVKDIILALKEAKVKGMTFYNVVSIATIFEIVSEYMEKKSTFIENRSANEKSKHDGSTRTEYNSIAVGQERKIQRLEQINESKEMKDLKNERRNLDDFKNILNQTFKDGLK